MPIARAAIFLFSSVFSVSAFAQLPGALTTDPPVDKEHPASMDAFQIPSPSGKSGTALNAIAYLAAGAGPHPVAIVLHGFPGNEKNLDLAQAIRRAGWDAVFFDYRGSWGSPGSFSFGNSLEDTAAAIAYVRDPSNAARLRADPKRIVLVGHSMGGFMAAYAGAHDPGILGIGMISAADMGGMGGQVASGKEEKTAIAELGKNLEKEDILPLAGCTGQSLAKELIANSKQWTFSAYADLIGNRPLLLVTSDDGLAPSSESLAGELLKQGSKRVTLKHFDTDHSYSDHRIALEATVLNWLGTL
jgi:pimeloyl-ACP methyl ester carboxylesterase